MITHNYNTISKGGRLIKTLSLDAQNFVDAAGLTDNTQIYAIDFLVDSLKSANLWDKMKAIYPLVGGTDTAHKWNLKDIRDLDAAFRLTFNGTITHNSSGIQGDGSTGYANTYIIPYNDLYNFNHNVTISVNLTEDGGLNSYDLGCFYPTTGDRQRFYCAINGASSTVNSVYHRFQRDATNNPNYIDNNSLGIFSFNTSANNNAAIFKNGILKIRRTSTSITTLTAVRTCYIGAINVGAADYFSKNRYSFISIGESLTDIENLKLYNIVQQYQTILGRQV